MITPDGNSNSTTLQDWYNNLSRTQAGILGGVAGYIIGLISGPILRLLLSVGVIVLFGFLGRHLEKKFESRLGFIGVIAAILACTSMGPFQKVLGNIIGPIITNSSKFAFAILGIYLILQLHDSSSSDASSPKPDSTDQKKTSEDEGK